MKSIIFVAAVLSGGYAFADSSKLRVEGARIDLNTNELVLKISGADCNRLFGSLDYHGSGRSVRASFGPHIYKLNVMSTAMGCPHSKKITTQIIRVRLPDLPKSQQVVIGFNNQTLHYSTKYPLSAKVAIRDGRRSIPEPLDRRDFSAGAPIQEASLGGVK